MKEFIYNQKNYDLNPSACFWLKQIGLKETRWFLDAAWILSYYDELTYKVWIGE